MGKTVDYNKKMIISVFPTVLVSLAVTEVLQLSDAIIASLVLHEERVLSAIGLCTTAFLIATFIGTLIARGSGIMYNLKLGRNDKKSADIVFSQGLLISAAFSVLLLLASFLCEDTYLNAFGSGDAAVMQYSHAYYGWYRFVNGLIPFFFFFTEMNYADGAASIVGIANIAMASVKIGTSVLLSTVGGMGVAGISLGSFLGYLAGTLIMSVHFFRKASSFHFVLKLSRPLLKQTLDRSIVDAVCALFLAGMGFSLNLFSIRMFGDAVLPITALVIQMISGEGLFDSVGEAMTPFLSVYVGEKNNGLCRHTFKIARRLAVLLGVSVSVLCFICARPFAILLGIVTPELLSKAVTVIRIVSVTMLGSAMMYLYASYYVVAGRTGLGVLCSFLKDFFLPTALGVLGGAIGKAALGPEAGFFGLWCGISLGFALTVPVLHLIIRIRYGKDAFALIQEPDGMATASFDFPVTTEEIIRVRDRVFAFCKERNISARCANRMGFIAEEMLGEIADNNKKRVYGEITVAGKGNTVRLIIRDSGEVNSVIRQEPMPDSIRKYCIDSMMQKSSYHDYLLTNGRNRYVFEFTDE